MAPAVKTVQWRGVDVEAQAPCSLRRTETQGGGGGGDGGGGRVKRKGVGGWLREMTITKNFIFDFYFCTLSIASK